ncbi:MAG: 4Fe-4S binding protein, partial [Petrimonas sp.]|nr:4Fe-4S binding protein [Petrimonas sp.]
MVEYLEFKDAKCKDCYKCLRECPVKAIEVINHQAKIIKDRCILCGKCTVVCPQNAKIVHSELNRVYELLKG